jgi:hypothetical protein
MQWCFEANVGRSSTASLGWESCKYIKDAEELEVMAKYAKRRRNHTYSTTGPLDPQK